MSPETRSSTPSIHQLLVVRAEPVGQFTAQVVGLPEIHSTAASREAAIQQVRNVLG